VSPTNDYITATFGVLWSVGLYIWFYNRQIDSGHDMAATAAYVLAGGLAGLAGIAALSCALHPSLCVCACMCTSSRRDVACGLQCDVVARMSCTAAWAWHSGCCFWSWRGEQGSGWAGLHSACVGVRALCGCLCRLCSCTGTAW
jgi:hypothetical protein